MAAFFHHTGNEACQEILQTDGLGRVVAEHFVVDTLDHLLAHLLTDLDTGIVGRFLLVVACVGAFVQTFYEFSQISGVHAEAVYQIRLQSLGLRHTDGITQRVYVRFHVCLRSRRRTRRNKCCQTGSRDNTCFFHCCYYELNKILKYFNEFHIEN